MKAPLNGYLQNSVEGERKLINSELWHACAGPLVSLPPVGSLVVYFPQGHSEQVAASMQKDTDSIPSYPNLPSKLICMLHNVTLHADAETDEVYAQMTLQPVSKYDQEALLLSDMGLKQSKQPAEFFCKTLTASDTSTHGGFSVPRRAAEKIFPPLDFTMQPPAQEIVARDLHDQSWTFRHIYRGQPKRHLLTTAWSVFVSSKRLFAGDAVLFIRDEKSLLLLGIRRANRQQPALSSSVISSDSMHIGILAAAAHAAANNNPFTIFYNPRASPSEFVIPLAKYNKAMYSQVSLGMRFRMMFETEESGVRRYMGTITGVSDLDPIRWKSSQWRNLQVGWDESTAGERPSRVSIWDIEPVLTPFYICSPPFFRPNKFPKQPGGGLPDDEFEMENGFKRNMPWLDDLGMKDPSSSILPGLSLVQWMSMQQQQHNNHHDNRFPTSQSSSSNQLHDNNTFSTDDTSKLLNFQAPPPPLLSTTTTPPTLQSIKPNQHLPQLLQYQQQQQLLHSSSVNPQQPQHQQRLLQPQQYQQQQTQNQQQNQNSRQQPVGGCDSQAQQQQLLTGTMQPQQNVPSTNRTSSFPLTSSVPQDSQFEPQMEQQQQQTIERPHHHHHQQQQQQTQFQQAQLQLLQHNFSQRSHIQHGYQQSLSEQQLQLQLLQKLQQQQQQQQQLLLSPVSPPRVVDPQHNLRQLQQLPLPHQQQQVSNNSFSQFPINQLAVGPQKSLKGIRAPPLSGVAVDGNDPPCSTSPSTNTCQDAPSNFVNKKQLVPPPTLMDDSLVANPPTTNMIQELPNKPDIRIKHELSTSKGLENPKYKGIIATDQLEASSSATSYCLETGGLQHNFSLPGFCLDADVQTQTKNHNHPFAAANIDGLTPDALLSRGFDDSQNLLSNYGGTHRDVETELSTAPPISSQSFGLPDLSFKPVCSSDVVAINEATGALCNGLWGNQTQRMRTYTKVQKRGSVGRTIDVTQYKGYDELRHDLACMFGIEGQLEESRAPEWKLVYVDHENDILLVGDDPWEEFVSCVQSIKILSSAEVQQMSLDGDLGQQVPLPPPNQPACCGTDSGNAWKGQYEDNSAASFNR